MSVREFATRAPSASAGTKRSPRWRLGLVWFPALALGARVLANRAGDLAFRGVLVAPRQEPVEVDFPADAAALLPFVVELVDQPRLHLPRRVGAEHPAEGLLELVVVAGGKLRR